MGIIRGIKIYDVGLAIASPTFGITVENWASGDVSVMTIDETDPRLSVDWDKGFSIKSDMRSYPKEPSGSGGVITLNDGMEFWYDSFLSAGYTLEGSRVERTWSENGDKMLSQYFIDKVKQGIGFITLTLLSVSCQMVSDITSSGEPLTVGNWKNAELENIGENLTPLFDGVTFRQSINGVVFNNDEFGVPLSYGLDLIPTDPNFDTGSLTFPPNTVVKVLSGTGEGTIFTVNQPSAYKDGGGSFNWYSVTIINSYGVYTDDTNDIGLDLQIEDVTTISELSTFGFFTLATEYAVDSGATIDSINGDGVDLSNYTVDSGVLTLDTQYLGSSVKNVTVDNNTEYDMSALTSVGSSIDGSAYYRTGQAYTKLTTERVDDKKVITSQIVTSFGLVGLSYEISEDITGAKGICIDATISTIEPAVDGVFNIVIMGVWGAVNSQWASEEYEEELMNIEIPYGLQSAGTQNKILYIRNIGNQYFTDAFTDNTNDPFDDRDLTDGGLTASIRGRVNFEFSNTDILEAKPDKIYALIYSTLTTRDTVPLVAPITMEIREIALFGEYNNAPEVETLTADITGRDWGTMTTAITNVATAMDWSKFETVSLSVPTLPSMVRSYISKDTELKTDVALQRLHRESWTVGYLDKTGTYTVTSVAGKIGSDSPVASTHDFVLPHGYMLNGEILDYESDGLPTGGTIQYSRNSDGSFAKSVSITGADQDTYDSSYVAGVSDSGKAESLWNICRGIFLKTGVLYDVRKDMQELWWLYEENDAVDYFTNILEWNGGSDFIRNVAQLKIEVADIDSSGDVLPWIIGDACNVTIPNITGGALSGVVTGVKYNKEDESAVVNCRVGEIVPRADTITELGNIIVDTITELDTNTDTITEVGVV